MARLWILREELLLLSPPTLRVSSGVTAEFKITKDKLAVWGTLTNKDGVAMLTLIPLNQSEAEKLRIELLTEEPAN